MIPQSLVAVHHIVKLALLLVSCSSCGLLSCSAGLAVFAASCIQCGISIPLQSPQARAAVALAAVACAAFSLYSSNGVIHSGAPRVCHCMLSTVTILLHLMYHMCSCADRCCYACSCYHLVSAAMVSSTLELHKYATGRQARVVTAMTLLKSHLFRYACFAYALCTCMHKQQALPLLWYRRNW